MTRELIQRGSPLLLLALVGCGAPGEPGRVAAEFEATEAERIHAHLSRVESELRARDVSSLSASQQEARAETLEWLREYREARTYPHNHVLPGRRTPVFVDPHGTPCAVGYLLLRSGMHGLVEDVVREANLARVPELAADPRLVDWLDARGLTVDEAARIQPWYDDGDGWPVAIDTPYDYRPVTVALSIATVAAALYSARTTPNPESFEWAGALNFTTAVAHGVVLASADNLADVPDWVVGVNVGAMAIAAVVGARRFRRGKARADAERTAQILPVLGVGEHGVSIGLRLRY